MERGENASTSARVESVFTRYVVMLLSRRYVLRSAPFPGSTSKSPSRHRTTSSVMCTRLENGMRDTEMYPF